MYVKMQSLTKTVHVSKMGDTVYVLVYFNVIPFMNYRQSLV